MVNQYQEQFSSNLLLNLESYLKGNTDCGARFKKIGDLKAILITSLYAYPETNLYQFETHPDGIQFTIPNPDLNSVSICWSKSVSIYWFVIPDEIKLHELVEAVQKVIKMIQDPDKICNPDKKYWIFLRIGTTPDLIESPQDLESRDKKKAGLNFASQPIDLIGTSPDVSAFTVFTVFHQTWLAQNVRAFQRIPNQRIAPRRVFSVSL